MKTKNLLLILPVLLLMVSCGGSGSESSSSSNENAETTSETHSNTPSGEGTDTAIETELEGEVDPREVKTLEEWCGGEDEILYKAESDFNGDGETDLILIQKGEDEDTDDFSEAARTLMVLENAGGEGYKLSGKCETCVMCKGCGGMMGDPVQPLSTVDALPGQFSVSHYGGSRERWAELHTYAYNDEDGRWYLLERETTLFDALDPEGAEDVKKEPHELGDVPMEDVKL